jgi:hypothetical protein
MAVDSRGEKLSKQSGAPPLDLADSRALLRRGLMFLGQAPSKTLDAALRAWNPGAIPAARALAAPP